MNVRRFSRQKLTTQTPDFLNSAIQASQKTLTCPPEKNADLGKSMIGLGAVSDWVENVQKLGNIFYKM